MDKALVKTIGRILAEADEMTIATLRPDGFPQATTVSFVNDGLTLYFGCDPDSQKARNIARDGRVSLTVNAPYEDWEAIRGLSMAARAERITDADELGRVGTLMFEKFPQVAAYVPEDPADICLMRVAPIVISVLDYSKGFGHTDLVEL